MSALYERYGARVYTFCLGRLGDREDAADAVQDTYANAWRALRDGCKVRRPLPWLLTIASNVCASRYRARRAREGAAPLIDDAEATFDHLPLNELADLPTALRALPEAQRRAFVLRELHGCSYSEIGIDLGSSHAAVAALLHRSRRAVAASLGEAGRRVLVAFPLPGVFRSFFGGGAATVMATAAGTVVLMAPQPGTALPQGTSPPPAAAGTRVAATVPPRAATGLAMRGTPEASSAPTPAPEPRVTVIHPSPDGAAPASSSEQDAGFVSHDIGGATIAGVGGAVPEPPPTVRPRAEPAGDSQQPPATPESPRAPEPPHAGPQGDRPVAQADGNPGPPADPGSRGKTSPEHPGSSEATPNRDPGPPTDPGSQGKTPPEHPGTSEATPNGDPGPPADPGSQGKTAVGLG